MNSNLKWFQFRQNNSGGSFHRNENLSVEVFIQAHNKREAISIGEDLGMYFNGVEDGMDCPCCGDRWSEWCSEVDESEFTVGDEVRVHRYVIPS